MTTTLSIRVPMEMRRWLERFAKRRGSVGMAATRLLEEARRREDFPAVEFRDTRLGRVAYVQGTRLQVAFIYGQTLDDPSLTTNQIAETFSLPQWKAAGVWAYIEEFAEECRKEWEDIASSEARELRCRLPNFETFEVASL